MEKFEVVNIETFGDLWQVYITNQLSSLQPQTQRNRIELAKFFDGITAIPLKDFTAELMSQYLTFKKQRCAKNKNHKRKSFDNELKLLRAVFNWYREHFDYRFIVPITKAHWKLSRITSEKKTINKMTEHELIRFLNAIDSEVYRDLAIFQFLLALRVQEAAGVRFESVDLDKATVLIKDVIVWGRNKRFESLKEVPKNGEIRCCHLSNELLDIVKRRFQYFDKEHGLVFHDRGHPLSYRAIQYHYNKALKKVGLYGKFSSTHFIRHSMATLTRIHCGSLEVVQAVTGHKDQKLVQHYAKFAPSDHQKMAVNLLSEKLVALSSL